MLGLLILLLVLMYINPPINMNTWNKAIIICIIILLTDTHLLLGLVAAGMFMYKLSYRETFQQKRRNPKSFQDFFNGMEEIEKKKENELIGLDETLRPKESNSLFKN